MSNMLPQQILDILCCPKCHDDLLYESGKNTLTCRKCDKVYAIKNGIPIMIIDEEPKVSKNDECSQ